MSDEIREVFLDREPVELFKLLKFENLVMSGGEAKHAVAGGEVRVNGQVETRKAKKIVGGDRVSFNGVTLVICRKAGEP